MLFGYVVHLEIFHIAVGRIAFFGKRIKFFQSFGKKSAFFVVSESGILVAEFVGGFGLIERAYGDENHQHDRKQSSHQNKRRTTSETGSEFPVSLIAYFSEQR